MSEQLHVEQRTQRGKRFSRQLRSQGHVPAVLYGHGEEIGKPVAGGRRSGRHAAARIEGRRAGGCHGRQGAGAPAYSGTRSSSTCCTSTCCGSTRAKRSPSRCRSRCAATRRLARRRRRRATAPLGRNHGGPGCRARQAPRERQPPGGGRRAHHQAISKTCRREPRCRSSRT